MKNRAGLGGPQKRKHPRLDLLGGEGLADVALRSSRDGAQDKRLAAFGCNHHDGHPLGEVLLAPLFEELKSIHDRHVDVAENQGKRVGIATVAAERLKRLLAV